MKKLLLIGLTTVSLFSFDGEFNDGCFELYELGQKKLSIKQELTEMADREIGTRAKDLYYWADVAKSDFKDIADAFSKCQSNKAFSFNVHELDTFEREKLGVIQPCSNTNPLFKQCVEVA